MCVLLIKKNCIRTGVSVGMSSSGIVDIHDALRLLDQKKYRKISPHLALKVLVNIPGAHISIGHGLQVSKFLF